MKLANLNTTRIQYYTYIPRTNIYIMDYNKYETIKWNPDTNYALGLYKLLTKSLGIWPLDPFGIIVFLQLFFNSFIQCLVTAIYIYELITKENCGLITDIVDVLSLVTSSIMSIFKIILPLINKKRMSFVIKSAIKDWANVRDENSKKIMLKHAFLGRILFFALMIGTYMSIICIIYTNPPTIYELHSDQLNENVTMLMRNIPVGPNCWVSTSMSTSIYYGYYSLVTVHLALLCTTHVSIDAWIFGTTLHVCGQFKLLYADMESLNGKTNFFTLRKQINQLAQRHTYLIQIANELEETFNLIILLRVASTIFLTSISGILLLLGLKNGNSEIIISAVARIYILYFELYMYSLMGELLSTQTRSLQLAIYNCSWYEMSPLLTKDLLFIITRTNYTYHLTAGKICYMNLSNFKDLFKRMFSYFSFLRLLFRE